MYYIGAGYITRGYCNMYMYYTRSYGYPTVLPADAVSEESGFLGDCQLLQLHPLTLQYLVLAGLKVIVQRSQTADKVEVRAVKGIWHVMVLAESQDRPELCGGWS